ncbi:MAG: class I SAM-dependent methyltransferase [Flexilinea sp.]
MADMERECSSNAEGYGFKLSFQKRRIQKMFNWTMKKLKMALYGFTTKTSKEITVADFDLTPSLPLPNGVSEKTLYSFVTSIRVADAPESEMHAYATHDFRRFVYTWGLAKDLNGSCLELGANPYFTTMLLREFTTLDLHLANYFGLLPNGEQSQNIRFNERDSQNNAAVDLHFQHFNVEKDTFPYSDNQFDLVIFAEIIEHLLNDPCIVLREISRVLKPEGHLILTTPNVARLENVTRLIAGANIYDPYSGYGPYGRHNREYNRHELVMLLRHEGFEPEIHFTADVHTNNAATFMNLSAISPLIQFRSPDLG